MSEHVFAYGSNMCSGRFRDYKISPEDEGRAALLRGYRLRFNKLSGKDTSGKANVEPHPDGEVWGVLYSIPEADLKILDSGEGRGYYRIRLPISLTGGEAREVWVYVASKPSNDPALHPYNWYKRFLVDGAQEHFLPPEYIAELERIDAFQDPDEQRDLERRALSCR
jgi:cation transport regulator ChaC